MSGATEVTKIRVDTMRDVLDLIPHNLGFHPIESLVVVVLVGVRLRLVMRADLPLPPEGHRELPHLARDRAGGDTVMLVTYSDTVQDMGPICTAFGEAGLRVLATSQVTGDRYFCRTEDCTTCPPDGDALATAPTPATAALIAAGAPAAVATRADLTNNVQPLPRGDRIEPVGPVDLRAAITVVERLVEAEPMAVGTEAIALVASTLLASLANRDRLSAIRGSHSIDFWSLIARHCPHPDIYATAAVHHYLAGNCAAVLMITDMALAVDPDHSWSRVLATGAAAGLPPAAMDHILDEVLAETP